MIFSPLCLVLCDSTATAVESVSTLQKQTERVSVYHIVSRLLHECDKLLKVDGPRPVVVNPYHLFVDLKRRSSQGKQEASTGRGGGGGRYPSWLPKPSTYSILDLAPLYDKAEYHDIS